MNKDKEIYLQSQNDTSHRTAKLELEEITYYLYLTKKDSKEIEKDALAFMIEKPPKEIDWDYLRKSKGAPYLSQKYETENTLLTGFDSTDFSMIWSDNGNSVALLYKSIAIAFIVEEEKIGFSKATKESSPIVHAWNENIFRKKFRYTTCST